MSETDRGPGTAQDDSSIIPELQISYPAGRAFWSFRILSANPPIRDHVFTTRKPVIFREACREARELAKMRRSEKIIPVPNR